MPRYDQTLPLSKEELEIYRLRARRQQRQNLSGGHQMRRKGQSLTFHDYRDYLPGDDIRHVDWRASYRLGDEQGLLVKEFTAEEQLTIVISLDFRESMWLPQACPKILLASWLAEAMVAVAARSGDEVWLHRLFGKGSGGPIPVRGSNHARSVLYSWWREGWDDEKTNLERLNKSRPPAAVWLILSDFYFPKEERSLTRAVRLAQESHCWAITLDLDSWPHERVLLGLGSRWVEGPEPGDDGTRNNRHLVELDDQKLDKVAGRIQVHKDHFRRRLGKAGHDAIHWLWPGKPAVDAAAFFRTCFHQDAVLARLFMRERLT